jgi:hypothetical protein
MPLGNKIQDAVHTLETGFASRALRWGVVVLGLVMFLLVFNLRAYKNMNTIEAMDAAQLARNLAGGKGYSTLFIRPFSIFLVTNKNGGLTQTVEAGDAAILKHPHPDLANPPVYPVLIAGLMKIFPGYYSIPSRETSASDVPPWEWSHIWNNDGRFWWYPGDFMIAIFNEILFLLTVWLVFRLARKLFDSTVAWVSCLLMIGTELYWRFAVSGLSTILVMLLFVGLVWIMVLIEEAVRTEMGNRRIFILAGLAGGIVAMGLLTRYSFGWLIIPVVVFIILFGGKMRVPAAMTVALAFAVLISPWIIRNFQVSGTPFGVSSFVYIEDTPAFQEARLQRDLQPIFHKFEHGMFFRKITMNLRVLVSSELPKLGGSWISSFFLVGLMLTFKNPAISHLRYFILMCLPVLMLAQAGGRSFLSAMSPEINTENLLVLLGPIVLIYGVALFVILLEQLEIAMIQLRYLIIGVFFFFACLPLILVFAPPKGYPVMYPPYYPPSIQQVSNWMNDGERDEKTGEYRESELMMSDMPWAVAWYGNRQCIWTTLTAQDEFFAVNDYLKPVKALYLTPLTMDAKFLTEWIRPGEISWGSFVLESLMRKEIPPNFPLRKAPNGFLPEQLFLTDWTRWTKPEADGKSKGEMPDQPLPTSTNAPAQKSR